MRHNQIWGIAVFLSVLSGSALAQFNSSIQGTVTDPSHGTVPDAKVRVISATTDVLREAVTSGDGLYRVLSLAPGDYRVVVEKSGFQTAEKEGVHVSLDETARIDFTLNLGSVSEKVTVEAAPPLVETEEGRVSGQIDSRQLHEMPLNTRNVLNLLALQPGVTAVAFQPDTAREARAIHLPVKLHPASMPVDSGMRQTTICSTTPASRAKLVRA